MRQQSTAAFDLWDAADVHEATGEHMDTQPHSNPMKTTDLYDSFNDNFDREQDQLTVEGTVDNYVRSAVPIRNLDGTPTNKLSTALDLLTGTTADAKKPAQVAVKAEAGEASASNSESAATGADEADQAALLQACMFPLYE